MAHRARILGIAAAALVAAPANAACWTREDIAAAKVRDLQTGLEIAATLCQAAGHDGMADYRSFAAAGRRALATANQRLRARFYTLYGNDDGARRFDRFTAGLSEDYAGQTVEQASCMALAAIAREGAQATTIGALVGIADRIGVVPKLPEASCPVTLAANSTAARP